MEEVKEIEHEYTSNIICPYCGAEDHDSWEVTCDDGEQECCYCENKFFYERIVTVEFSTKKIES